MKDLILGIDFGSENIYVSYIKNNIPQLVENSEGGYYTPTYIFENADHTFLIGKNAKKKGGICWLRDVNQVDTFTFKQKQYLIKDFCLKILQYVKDFCQKKFGNVLLRSVIALPVYFKQDLCSLIKECANQVGLNVMAIINEVAAITLNYWQNNPNIDLTNLAVYDLGAHNLTIAKVDILHQMLIFAKDVYYNPNLGLNNWITDQVQYFLERANKQLAKDYPDCNVNQQYLTARIMANLEAALLSLNEKKELIVAINEPIGLSHASPIMLSPMSEKGIDASYDIFIKPLIKLISNPTNYTLIMAGGGSNIKVIKNQIDLLGFKQVIHLNNAEQTSAQGAAWFGAIISGQIPGTLVLTLTNNLVNLDDK